MRNYKVKKVKVMFDYCASGLWDYNTGIMIDSEDISITPFLEKKLNKWVAKMDKLFLLSLDGESKYLFNSNKFKLLEREIKFIILRLKILNPTLKFYFFDDKNLAFNKKDYIYIV